MCRKRKEEKREKNNLIDRIGEEVILENCPECPEHPDCFACLEGRCTALSESGGMSCVFYKPADRGINECRDAYEKLKETGRYDLLQKYFKAFTALGFLDEEIEEEQRRIEMLRVCQDSDYETEKDQVDSEDQMDQVDSEDQVDQGGPEDEKVNQLNLCGGCIPANDSEVLTWK